MSAYRSYVNLIDFVMDRLEKVTLQITRWEGDNYDLHLRVICDGEILIDWEIETAGMNLCQTRCRSWVRDDPLLDPV